MKGRKGSLLLPSGLSMEGHCFQRQTNYTLHLGAKSPQIMSSQEEQVPHSTMHKSIQAPLLEL